MKILLACLMCLILPATECFALKGGPPYPRSVVVNGSYSGLFLDPDAGSDKLGIFSVSIQQSGASDGTIIIFTGARTFTGNIQGRADSRTGTFRGIVEAIPRTTVGSGTVTTLGAHADGSIDATVRNTIDRGFTRSRTTHLTGTAPITTTGTANPGQTVYIVDGIKQ